MSSFDRKSAQKDGAGKKPLIVAALAVALAVIVVRQIVNARATDAAVPDPAANTALAVPEQNTADVIKSLVDDPTAQWLNGQPETTSPIDQPPQDPFQMSSAWRASLLKVVLAPPPQVGVDTHTNDPQPMPRPAGSAWDPSLVKLQGIFKDNRRSYAIVNGSIISEGSIVAGARIVEIREASLVCQPLTSLDGATIEVMLKTRPH